MSEKIAFRPNSTSKSDTYAYIPLEHISGTSRYNRFPAVRHVEAERGVGFWTNKGEIFYLEVRSEQTSGFAELPASMSEEELDEFLVSSGVIDKLISQLSAAPRNPDWEAELDEL